MRLFLRGSLFALLLGLLSACGYDDPLVVDKNWLPKRITGHIAQVEPGFYAERRSTIQFRNSAELRSDLVDMSFIGQIPARSKPPYVIFSARRCYNCESNRSVFIHSPTSGKLSKKSTRYRYPGFLYSHVNGSLIEKTRMFFGDCLPGHSAATVVWFVETKRDTIEWRKLVVIVEAFGNKLNEDVLENPAPVIEPTLSLVEQERCREIKGHPMSSEP